MLPTAQSSLDMFDEDNLALPGLSHPTWSGIRLPDGRALSWAEYGSTRGLPCILIPDHGSSRLAPGWLLHDSALPSAIRLMALDRPGTGHSDPVGLGSTGNLAADLEAMALTLAVGRVALIGIGDGADVALTLAANRPDLVVGVAAVAVRLVDDHAGRPGRRWFRRPRPSHQEPLLGWLDALDGGDPLSEAAWVRSLDRMVPRHRQLLGERWAEEDFRAAIAADAAENDEWTGVDATIERQTWVDHPDLAGRPVHFWHGAHDGPTTVRDLQTLADERSWTVTSVAGPTALFDCWPQILTTTTRHFTRTAA